MERSRWIAFAILFLFSVSLVSAAQIELNKQSFDSGGTLFAEISGNFIDQVTESNVYFYRGHVQIPMVYELEKINEEFYLYASLENKAQANYSLRIKNVRYYQGAIISDETIIANFSISDETADFSVTPGFVKSSSDFSIEVKSLALGSINVDVDSSNGIQPVQSSFDLSSGGTETINILLDSPSEEETLTLNTDKTSYTFTLFFFNDSSLSSETDSNQSENDTGNETQDGEDDGQNSQNENETSTNQTSENETSTEEGNLEMRFEVGSLEISVATDSKSKRVIYLENIGEESIEDIGLNVSNSLEDYISLSPINIIKLEEGESERIELLITSDSKEDILEGLIMAYSEKQNLTTLSSIELNFIKDFIPSDEEKNGTKSDADNQGDGKTSSKLCAEVAGDICSDDEFCDGETFIAKDGVCCLGICEESSNKGTFGSTGRWIGWGLILIVTFFLYWFFKKKFKKAGKKEDGLSKFIRKRR